MPAGYTDSTLNRYLDIAGGSLQAVEARPMLLYTVAEILQLDEDDLWNYIKSDCDIE